MYMDRKQGKNNRPYGPVRIKTEKEEEKALEILYSLGLPFEHIGIQMYKISSGQCSILSKKGILYEHVD